MLGRQTANRLRRKRPKPRDSTATPSQTWVNSQINAMYLDIDKHIAYVDAMVLDQVLCRATETGWLLILKAHRGKASYAAFIATETLSEAYELAGEFAARGCLTWQRDKWPPKIKSRRKP